MRTKPLRLLLLASLSLPLLADPPAPTPAPAAAAAAVPAVAETAPTPTPTPTPGPTMPSTLKLTNGTVLHNVTVVRWMKESVTVRHTGGADTIYYNYIAEPDRTTVKAARDDAIKNQKPDSASQLADVAVKGTVLVATEDGSEVPLGGAKVYAIRMDALNELSTNLTRVTLPKPLASSVTGADGQFAMVVPAGEDFFIFAKATKFVGQSWEYYEWRVPITQVGDRQSVTLSSSSMVPLAEQKAVSFSN
jgi:hypothetical protein